MKYGVIPSNLIEWLALRMGKVPVPLLDSLASIMKARSLMAGVRLGIFESLRDGPLTAGEIADRCRLDANSTELLLRVLAAADYLELRGGQFRLSELARQTMIAGAEHEMFGYVLWNYTQWEMVAEIDDLVRTGRGRDFHQTLTAPDAWANYQRGMLEVARFSAPLVAARIPVKAGARRLLDLAGSHGLFGAAICRKHPPMRSTVLDLPAAIEHARELARAEKIADVVEHRAGNLLADDYGSDNDVVLLSNILHHFDEATNIRILRRAFDSLTARGTVAIWEMEAPEKNSTPTAADFATLLFRLTSNAQCYNGKAYTQWLRQVGFTEVRASRPALSPGSILMTGIRP